MSKKFLIDVLKLDSLNNFFFLLMLEFFICFIVTVNFASVKFEVWSNRMLFYML